MEEGNYLTTMRQPTGAWGLIMLPPVTLPHYLTVNQSEICPGDDHTLWLSSSPCFKNTWNPPGSCSLLSMSCLVLLCKKPFSVLTPSLALSGFTVGGVLWPTPIWVGQEKRAGGGTGCRLCPLEPGVHPSPRERLSNRVSPGPGGRGQWPAVWEGSGLGEEEGSLETPAPE